MASRKKCLGSLEGSLKIWLLHLLGINSGASYFSHSCLAWSNVLWKTFSQLLLFCRRISSTLSMSSVTASTSNSFFCRSFETGRIIPEVCCITKAAFKNVHFCTDVSKAALVATSSCLFSCCYSSRVETTAGNSVSKFMIESCLSTQRVAQIGFSFCREETEPKTPLSTLSWNIDTRGAERDRKTRMSDIVVTAFLITGNCDEVLMTKLRTWLQQWAYMAKGYNSFTLAWTPRYFTLIILAPS